MTHRIIRRIAHRSAALLAIVLPTAAAAHPGHGADALAATPLHYLAEPAHALGALVALASVVVLAHALRRRSRS